MADFYVNFLGLSGAKAHKSCRSRKMLQNEYLVAKIGFDDAENEFFEDNTASTRPDPRTSLIKFEDHRFCRSQFLSHAERLILSRVSSRF